MPHYNVSIFQDIGLEEVDEGQEYTPVVEAWWSGDADSPETAEENARAVWREKYDDVPPDDAEVKITPRPLVCPRCEGRGKLARYALASTRGQTGPWLFQGADVPRVQRDRQHHAAPVAGWRRRS